jgi:signal transduction histidine kinase/CheY-like chemotaxis protein
MAWQRIVRERREYNQWVANQTLEDYALRFTAKSSRKWSALGVANTALGAISFLALEAIGGAITLSNGFTNAAAAIVIVGIIIAATGLPIAYYAAKFGVDIDLLTRGAGFGYIGSTITSLIYASFTFIFFAIEAVIMSTALEMCLGIPLAVGYVISSLAVIPLVTHGITFISRFQRWTQPLWVVLHALPFIFIATYSADAFGEWTRFSGRTEYGIAFNPLLFGAAASVVFSLIAQIGEQIDFLRFLPRPQAGKRLEWWGALLSAGPGWILLGIVKMLAGSFLAFLVVRHGLSMDDARQPTKMYYVAFQSVFASPGFAIAFTGAFVIVSQLKINVTNAYAGSIAWSNFFSRLTHSHPGRVVWLFFNVGIALLLMELGIYRALEQILGLYSNVAAAWVGALVSDLVINKSLRLSPPNIEFRRAHLYDVNPVGVGSMTIAVTVAIAAYSGVFGPLLQAFTPFVALGVAFVMAPVIAYATDGKYYIARKPRRHWAQQESIHCCICELKFEPEDMAYCPAYSGPICSLCCSLDARCHDSCKASGRLAQQLAILASALLPRWIAMRLNSRFVQYLGVLVLLATVIGGVLSLTYFQAALDSNVQRQLIRAEFWKVFFVLLIIAGIAAWLFVLAHESRRTAQEESKRQTTALMREIQAHKRTDAQLQKAKEAAEAANLAKSRYLVGISHEVRTPLNVVLGYAQLLDRDSSLPPQRRDAIKVIRRSADHLSGLIEGLVDIAKIEAGRLQIQRNEVRIGELLEQVADMFRLQASAKGIEFRFPHPEFLPAVVHTDERRLRQILINLLSNAVKFTPHGFAGLRVHYRGQVGEFEIEDSGIGIRAEDRERIFEPFERGEPPNGQAVPGMGLGLTIAKLLTEVMGGEISVTSEPGKGSTFRVKLLLTEVSQAIGSALIEAHIRGYAGPRRTVMVVDDDAGHRGLMRDLLSPLDFVLLEAADARACLELTDRFHPDIFLLDVSLPEGSGWELARRLRQRMSDAPIIMISANASEPRTDDPAEQSHDAYLVKPVDLMQLLEKIGQLLHLDWLHDENGIAMATVPPRSQIEVPARSDLDDLRRLGRIGYVRGIRAKLDEIEKLNPGQQVFVTEMRSLVRNFELKQYMAALEALLGNEPYE